MVWLTLLFEKLIAKDWISSSLGFMLHACNAVSLIFVPGAVINLKAEHIGPGRATIAVTLYTILFLKMWSYIQVNHWCRNHHSTCRRAMRFPSVSDLQTEKFRKTGNLELSIFFNEILFPLISQWNIN